MVEASYRGAGGEAKSSEIIMIIAFIAGLIIVVYVLAKKEIGNLGKGLVDIFKIEKEPTVEAMNKYEIASAGAYMGMPITGVAPSPTILAAMERYYGSGDIKTYTNPVGQVWAIDAPSIDPTPISSETPSGYIHKVMPGDIFETYFWVYGCDESGHNCMSSKQFAWYEFAYGKDLT